MTEYLPADTAPPRQVALLIDYENLFYGLRNGYDEHVVPDLEALCSLAAADGRLTVAAAFACFEMRPMTGEFGRLVQAGIQPVAVPGKRTAGEHGGFSNCADLELTVEALRLAYEAEHIDTFWLVSGDGGMAAVARSLRRKGRRVVVVASRQGLSGCLSRTADQVIYYEDAVAPALKPNAEPDPRPGRFEVLSDDERRIVLQGIRTLEDELPYLTFGRLMQHLQLPDFGKQQRGDLVNNLADRGLLDRIEAKGTNDSGENYTYRQFKLNREHSEVRRYLLDGPAQAAHPSVSLAA